MGSAAVGGASAVGATVSDGFASSGMSSTANSVLAVLVVDHESLGPVSALDGTTSETQNGATATGDVSANVVEYVHRWNGGAPDANSAPVPMVARITEAHGRALVAVIAASCAVEWEDGASCPFVRSA